MSRPRVVLTSGCFDLLHRGHINLLWEARDLGDVLVVGVITDYGIMAYKGIWPVESCSDRIAYVRALGIAHVVAPQDTTDPTPLLQRFLPDVYCHADGEGDWTLLRNRVAACGVPYFALPYTPGISSSALRKQMIYNEVFNEGGG